MSSLMRCARSAMYSVRFAPRSMGISLWLVLAALPLAGRAQDAHFSATPSTACSPSWPSGASVPPIKITDKLSLAIPVKYLRYEWLNCRKSPSEIERERASLPMNAGAGFDFFLPDFSGYTMERFRAPFSIDEVHVAYVVSAREIEVDPNHPAHYPSNQLKNMFHLLADPTKYRDMYGLRCYEGRVLKNTIYCYSNRAGSDHQGILFTVQVPPYGPAIANPLMRTNYFSKRYGGIEVAWWTNVKNMPRWRDIDAQIWKFLAVWNVTRPKKSEP
jgi:hypothetical protein